jgi:mannan endo-1,6-alpha-mannosidase
MSALSVLGATQMNAAIVPVTKDTGGTSKSDPSAGSGTASTKPGAVLSKITTADRAGAGILTLLIICGVIGGSLWIIL